jgi:hypothetical protein
MNRFFFFYLITFSVLISNSAYCQKTKTRKLGEIDKVDVFNKVRYEVSASANALMCPFLSPQLMDKLSKTGADSLYKDDKLILHFITTKQNEIDDIEINKMVEAVGYQSRNFKILRKYEK